MKKYPSHLVSIGLVSAIAMSTPWTASAESSVGNGGDAVVCYRPGAAQGDIANIVSVELLDFYEGRVQRGLIPNLGDPQGPINTKIAQALAPLKKLSPSRYNDYANWAATFNAEMIAIPNAQLVDVKDSDHVVLPRDCFIEQIALQINPRFAQDKRYTLNKDLWDRMDQNNRAGLILHEVIYRETKANQSNSIGARYMNQLLVSGEVRSLDFKQFATIAEQVGYIYIEFNGSFWSPKGLSFYPTGKVQLAYAVDCRDFNFRKQVCPFATIYTVLGNKTLLHQSNKPYEFFANGNLRSIPDGFRSDYSKLTVFGQEIQIQEASFYESGRLRTLAAHSDSRSEIRLLSPVTQGQAIVKVIGRASFFENGFISELTGDYEIEIKTNFGLNRHIWDKSTTDAIRFYPNGNLQSFYSVVNWDGFTSPEIPQKRPPLVLFGQIQMYENGELLSAEAESKKIQLNSGRELWITDLIEFHPTGEIKKTRTRIEVELTLATGGKQIVPANSEISLDRQGNLVSSRPF
jgi:hypothetical protein